MISYMLRYRFETEQAVSNNSLKAKGDYPSYRAWKTMFASIGNIAGLLWTIITNIILTMSQYL